MIKFWNTIFALFLTLSLFSQETDKIDSLYRQLENDIHDTIRIQTLNELAEELVYTDADEAMKWLNKSIELCQTLGDKKGLSKAYVFKGIAYYYNYLFDSTLIYYNKCLDINLELNDSIAIAKVENNIGLIYHMQSNFTEAIKHYKKGLAIRQQINDKDEIANSYNNIGAIYYAQGDYEMALEYYFNTLHISEESNYSSMIIASLSNIGAIYEEQAKNERALEYYKKSNKLAQENKDKYSTADTYSNIANIYASQLLFDSARYTYAKALDLYEELNDINGLIILYNYMGKLLIQEYDQNNTKKEKLNIANEYLIKSLNLNTGELEDLIELCKTYQNLGDLNIHKGNYILSVNYNKRALEIASEIEAKQYIIGSFERLSKAYSKIGQYKKAYESHLSYKNLSDSLSNDENIEALTQMSMQHEFDKQQKEQEFIQLQKELAYQQELKQQRIIRYAILAGLLIVLLFAAQMLRSFQRKKKDNELLEKQNHEIEKQKEEITDSIIYAKRIQNAILPSSDLANEILPEHFILFRPRDIVSGDYYWMHKVGNKVIMVAADCTGHGVPGVFMSMLGVSFLNEIVNKNNIHQPHLILNNLRAAVKKTLGQTGKDGEAKDGMDIALCVLDIDTMILEYAGAYNPLYLYRNGELLETKADKMPIGIYIREKESFTNHEIQLQKGDTFYIFSDGFADQFGGPDGRKFKSKPFKRLLGEIQTMNMADQKTRLIRIFDDWRGEIDQIDDVIILGIRI